MATSNPTKMHADPQNSAPDESALLGGASNGAHATPTQEASPKETTSFTLRVPQQILTTLDDHIKKQPYKMPRQQWILEAIVQRLEREILAEYLPASERD